MTFNKLFRPEPISACRAAFPEDPFSNLARTLFDLQTCFEWGRTEAGYWDDAEQFLSYIDDAFEGQDPIKRTVLQDLLLHATRPKPSGGVEHLSETGKTRLLQDMHIHARRALAAQCSRFLLFRKPEKEEVWLPFRKWATSLDAKTDVILTFNYDCVLETLDPSAKHLQILMPTEARDGARVPVYKLHGSADWVLVNGGELQRVESPMHALTHQPQIIAIAAPGRGKAEFVSTHFENLWNRAEGELRTAGGVIVVGYGFPKTDSGATLRVLDAIREAEVIDWVRELHVILGPDMGSSASIRVLALLQACTGGRDLIMTPASSPVTGVHGHDRALRIKQHPLWSQDFLGDWVSRVRPVPEVTTK